jgi:hypothetical protein
VTQDIYKGKKLESRPSGVKYRPSSAETHVEGGGRNNVKKEKGLITK